MTDDKKVVELRPELATLKMAADEHRRCQHKYLFQQIASEACATIAVDSTHDLEFVRHRVLKYCDKMAEMILDKTEEIGKR